MSLFVNGSGYYDPTAGEAIKGMEKEMGNKGDWADGDIVEVMKNNGNTIEMLLIRCHSNYATALALVETPPGENTVDITSRAQMYSDAGKVQYVFYENICDFVKALTDDDFRIVKKAIRKALDLEEWQQLEEADYRLKMVMKERDEAYNNLIRMEAQLELMKELYREK